MGRDFDLRQEEGPFKTEIDELFVLSDGAPNLGRLTVPREILRAVRRWNRTAQVRIHTVYVGDERVEKDFIPPGAPEPPPDRLKPEEFMRRLAEENHGRFQEPAKG
jgi:hypothetical protein